MDGISALVPSLPAWLVALAQSPLLVAAGLAILCALIGSLVARSLPRIGRVLRLGGNLALVAVLGLTALQVARLGNPSLEFALPGLGLPTQSVTGGETRVALSPDGHYWIEALVNGEPHRFLVDTGATLTAVSEEYAAASGIEPTPGRMPIRLRTANGTMPAQLGSIDTLAFGNVIARDLDVVIAPGLDGINVLGMNFLSRLKGWRVEEGDLVLVPHHPQGEAT